MQHYDVIVIGSGVAGQTAASELAGAGKRVAMTDSREYGGTCALRGCEPKKVLFTASEVVERTRAQSGNGPVGPVALDWASLVAFKRSFTDPVPKRMEEWLAGAGVTLLHGAARFVSEGAVEVGGERFGADHFVVATGATPRPLGIPGGDLVHDSERFMDADELGDRVAFIGGGYVSFEFAHMAAAAGARVTILNRGPRVLETFDHDLTAMLVDGYRQAGIEVLTGAAVTEVRRTDGGLEVVCEDRHIITCDMAVHGAGRVPAVEALDLDAVSVPYGRRGIDVDVSMRSTGNPRVFAAGDVAAPGLPLTTVATVQARVAVANILEPGSAVFSPVVMPSVVFSDPMMASVGLTEEQATAQGLDVDVRLTDTSGWASSRRIGQRVSGAKTIVEKATGTIVGAHLLGHGAGDVINVFAAAIAGGLTAADLRGAVWAYPTASYEIVYLV